MQMSLGEIAVLHITSDYGYGSAGAGGVIPPNADRVADYCGAKHIASQGGLLHLFGAKHIASPNRAGKYCWC